MSAVLSGVGVRNIQQLIPTGFFLLLLGIFFFFVLLHFIVPTFLLYLHYLNINDGDDDDDVLMIYRTECFFSRKYFFIWSHVLRASKIKNNNEWEWYLNVNVIFVLYTGRCFFFLFLSFLLTFFLSCDVLSSNIPHFSRGAISFIDYY